MHVINLDPNTVTVGWTVARLPAAIEPAHDGLSGSFFAKATFRLVPDGVAVPWPDGALPLSGDVPFDGDLLQGIAYASDMVPYKPRADFAVVGTAHPPAGDATMFEVTTRIGTHWKSLVVFGARPWEPHFFSRRLTPGAARPAEPTPLRYQAAWGGPDCEANPIGRGDHTPGAPVIEMGPLTRNHARGRHETPAGFAPLPPMWPVRQRKTGTYGDEWNTRRWPWLPEDFDFSFYNATPPDQWFERHPVGDEECVFTNLHPTIPEYRTSLPAVRPRMVLSQLIRGALDFREVPLRLDTLWFDMDREQAVIVWRGHVPVVSVKLKEAKHLLVLLEPLREPGRSFTDLVAVIAAKTAPPPPRPRPAGGESPSHKLAAIKARLAAAGAAASASLAAAKAKAEARRDEALAGASPAVAARASTAAPVAPAARLASLTAAADRLASTPGVAPEHQAAVAAAIEAARRRAAAPPKRPPRPPAKPSAFDPRRARAKGAVNADLRGRSLAGLDLSGIDFTGANLCEAILTGANLASANLSRAALAGANLEGVNLTGAILDGADLKGCAVGGIVLEKASLHRASLAGLDLAGANLAGAKGRSVDFTAANLERARACDADFTRGMFTKARLGGADFSRGVLAAANLDAVEAWAVDFSGADLRNMRAGGGADFSGGVCERARAEGSAWRGARLDGVTFDRATLRRAVFTDARLVGARFDRADLREAVFEDADLESVVLTHANLMRADFTGADLTHAVLDGANLFEAAFRETVLDGATWVDARVARTRLAPL